MAERSRSIPARAVRGRFLRPHADARTFDDLPDALLESDEDGRIVRFGPTPDGCAVPETLPGTVWMPGFVDAHVHFPQTRVVGRSSGGLLTWLEETVFPEEARFERAAYADEVAAEFCRALIAHGTSTAAVYGSSHPLATSKLFAALDRSNLRAMAGLTLMDRGAPAALCLPAERALLACEALIEQWHGHDEDRLRFCVTPRFALSCTPELLRGAAKLAERVGLPIQTHLAETVDEVAAVAAAFPGHRSYLEVYASFGLVGPDTVFGHCIHLDARDWDTLAETGAAVAHCPDSNFFLGSGVMSLADATARGVRVGLGTDVGAGRSFSLRRTCAAAYDAALLRGARVGAAEVLWLATVGGARALGLGEVVGRLESGFSCDLAAHEVPAGLDTGALYDHLAFRAEVGTVRNLYVRGRRAV